jgi:4-diphosphocytidyl-2-C-methyl-D-erythritol kinase
LEPGLGGGSSDASSSLLAGNAAWGLNYSRPRLMELAAQLGSDVPFFLAGQAAVCRGRGERVEPVGPLPRLDVVVVKPPAGVATAEAYQRLQAGPVSPAAAKYSAGRLAELLACFERGSLARAGRLMTNRLQAAAAGLCGWIDRLRRALADAGCYAHLMTGSGSACFGVMRSTRQARRTAALLRARGFGSAFASATCR